VAWHKVIELLTVRRLVAPGGEWLHRQWSKGRLYRCLDRLLPHKRKLFAHSKQRDMARIGSGPVGNDCKARTDTGLKKIVWRNFRHTELAFIVLGYV
jgi:hypothetical protein